MQELNLPVTDAPECRNTIKSACFCNKLGKRKEYHTGETLGMFFEGSCLDRDRPLGCSSRSALYKRPVSLELHGASSKICCRVMLCGWKRRKTGQEGCLPTLQLISNTWEPAAVFSCLQITLRPSQFDSPCLGAFGHMPAPPDDL